MTSEQQGGMFDHIVDDAVLIDQADIVMRNEGAAKAHSKALNALRKHARGMDLQAGQRVRFGHISIPAIDRAGGGIHIPVWKSTVLNFRKMAAIQES